VAIATYSTRNNTQGESNIKHSDNCKNIQYKQWQWRHKEQVIIATETMTVGTSRHTVVCHAAQEASAPHT